MWPSSTALTTSVAARSFTNGWPKSIPSESPTTSSRSGADWVGVAKGAIESFHKINYWVNNDGLDEKQMMGQANEMVKDGLLKADAKPSYDKLVDKSLYAEAMERVEKMGGMSK